MILSRCRRARSATPVSGYYSESRRKNPCRGTPIRVKAWRAYIAGLGTSGVLIASFVLLLAVVSAIVAFQGYPGEASNDGLDRLDVGQTRPAAAVSKADRARADRRSAAAADRRGRAASRAARDGARSEGAGAVLGDRLESGGAAGGAGGSAPGGGGSGVSGAPGGGGGVLGSPGAGGLTGGVDQVVEDTTGSLGGLGDQVPREAPVIGGDVGGVVDQADSVVDGVSGQVNGVTDTVGGATDTVGGATDTVGGATGGLTGGG